MASTDKRSDSKNRLDQKMLFSVSTFRVISMLSFISCPTSGFISDYHHKALEPRYILDPCRTRFHQPFQMPTVYKVVPMAELRMIEKYGKGAEIFPPTNQFPIDLSNSFPGGVLPYPLEDESQDTLQVLNKHKPRRSRPYDSFDDTSIGWIISSTTPYGNTVLISLAISLVLLGFIRPMDLVSVAFISGYTVFLSMLASSPRFDAETRGFSTLNNAGDGVEIKGIYRPLLPALPPQGHIPSLFSNPLGHVFTQSDSYRLWLRVGAILGLVAPCMAIVYYSFVERDPIVVGAVARPLFLICCQSTHENILRRDITPLPLRILVPVMYNSARIGPLYEYMMLSTLGSYGKILAIGSFSYWSAHLFGFLIPIGVMRYLRAHFFCVEAQEVSIHEGHEESVL